MILRECLDCDAKLKDYRSVRCRSCAARVRQTGKRFSQEHKKKIAEKSKFKKGNTYGHRFKKDYTPWNKGKKYKLKKDGRKKPKGESSPCWKGDAVGYVGLHIWVKKVLGSKKKCQLCGLKDQGKIYHWANISGKYKREIRDWIRLCVPCHNKFDTMKRILK